MERLKPSNGNQMEIQMETKWNSQSRNDRLPMRNKFQLEFLISNSTFKGKRNSWKPAEAGETLESRPTVESTARRSEAVKKMRRREKDVVDESGKNEREKKPRRGWEETERRDREEAK